MVTLSPNGEIPGGTGFEPNLRSRPFGVPLPFGEPLGTGLSCVCCWSKTIK
jgi:hypothetical protein